jgi:CBS domain containing-hemolysin-like protein
LNAILLWTLIAAVLIDLLLAALNFSLRYARLSFLMDLRAEHEAAVDRTIDLLEQSHLRISLRMLVMLSHFSVATLGLVTAVVLLGWRILSLTAVGIVLGIVLVMLALEFLVEGLVLRNVESWALRLTPLGRVIVFVMRPLANLLLPLLGPPDVRQRVIEPALEEDLKTWATTEDDGGELEIEGKKMIYSIFQFGHTLCREIMVPRIDIQALEADTSIPDAITAVTASGHSRVPVYDDSIDNIIGILYVKDLLRLKIESDQTTAEIRDLLREVYFVPEAKRVSELLREMQNREVHVVLVVDEYGGTAGLVTLEDIVEEIVGEIRDEYDQGEELPYEKISANEFIFPGRIDLDDFNEVTGTRVIKEAADTLAGFIYGNIGRVPLEGEQVEVGDWVLTVDQVSRRRIQKVRALRLPPEENEENGDNGAGK